MSTSQRVKSFDCDVCSRSFQTRHGLKIHCTKQEHRGRQLDDDSEADPQRQAQHPGPRGFGHELAAFVDQTGADQSGSQRQKTTPEKYL